MNRVSHEIAYTSAKKVQNSKNADLQRLYESLKGCPAGINYSLDVVRGVLLVYFTRDPRKRMSPIPTR